MHDKIDHRGHDHSAVEITTACRECVTELAALVHSIHMSYNVADIYVTSDHGFLYEDKVFEEKDKHEVQESYIDKKTRYFLTDNGDCAMIIEPLKGN